MEDSGAQRRATLTLPPQSYADSYQALNSHPDRKRPGVWKNSNLLQGPKNEIVPTKPTQQSFTIHFNSGWETRDQQESFLANRGQQFANPFVVALAEATSLAQKGESLFKINMKSHCSGAIVRTEYAETKNGATSPPTVIRVSSRRAP